MGVCLVWPYIIEILAFLVLLRNIDRATVTSIHPWIWVTRIGSCLSFFPTPMVFIDLRNATMGDPGASCLHDLHDLTSRTVWLAIPTFI